MLSGSRAVDSIRVRSWHLAACCLLFVLSCCGNDEAPGPVAVTPADSDQEGSASQDTAQAELSDGTMSSTHDTTEARDTARPSDVTRDSRQDDVAQQPAGSYMGDEPPCPAGTVARGDAPPEGHHLWCEKPSGTKHGYSVTWYFGGQVMVRWNWDAGLLHGSSVSWHGNGQKSAELSYDHGVYCGPMTSWDEDGNVTAQVEYDPCSE